MRKTISIWLFLSLLILLFTGCSSREGEENSSVLIPGADPQKVTLYYTNETWKTLTLRSETIAFSSESSLKTRVDETIRILRDPSLLQEDNEPLTSILPEGLFLRVVTEVEYNDVGTAAATEVNVVSIEFSDRYEALTEAEKLILRTGLSQSLFSLGDVGRVDLYLIKGDETLLVDQILSSDRMIINQYDEGFYRDELKVTLYFAGGDGTKLVPEERTIRLGMTESLSMGIVRSLIEGPQTQGLSKTIPEGTKINDIVLEDNVCYIDFNDLFQLNHGGGETAEMLTVYSLVNSLTRISGIDHVQVLIEGQRVPVYKSYVPIEGLLDPMPELIQNP